MLFDNVNRTLKYKNKNKKKKLILANLVSPAKTQLSFKIIVQIVSNLVKTVNLLAL